MASSLSVLVALALVSAAFGQVTTLTYNSFDSSNSAQFQINGDASITGGRIQLTPSVGSAAGSVFVRNAISLTGPNGFQASFSAAFTFIMDQGVGGDGSGSGADGIVFVINAYSNQAGSVGGGIGYLGIPNSVGIEFDSWSNPDYGDIDGNHVGIDLSGSINSVAQRGYGTLLNNGAPKYAWVDYNGATQTLEVRIAEVNVRPAAAFLSRNVDLVAILGNPNVYVGWTAATGGSRERHLISYFAFTNTYAPIVTQVCGNGIVEGSEACDGGACCSTTCQFSSSSFTCRASNGPCDVAETCSGTSSSCPADSFASSSVTCRASAGVCDVAETCSGSSASCPADSFSSSSVTCRASAGVCDVAETCSGSSSSCPADSFASSSVTCRTSAGVCDVAESCTGSSAACPTDAFLPQSTQCRSSIGPCDPAEFCTGSSSPCPNDISGSFETACPGLALNVNGQTYSWLNFDVISFGDFNAVTGDVEGRLAVKRDAHIGAGWSVGYELHSRSTDLTLPYSIMVGRDLSFTSGDVYPNGLGAPYSGAQEDLFAGNTFNGASYLNDRTTGNCGGVSGCLDSQFDAVQQCYGGYQTAMAAHADNTVSVIEWSGLSVTCNSATDTTYYVSLTPAQMSQYTWVQLNGCNHHARWIINIGGTGPVTFTGASFPATAASVVYNVQGSGRTITVRDTKLDGSIVAPYNFVNQPNGVIVGKVIAADIQASRQMNRADCFTA